MQRLIASLPRSGTSYITHVFQAAFPDLDIKHEALGKDLSVSWLHPDTKVKWDKVAHQVRHPLGVIASLSTISWGGESWRRLFKALNNFGENGPWPVGLEELENGRITPDELVLCRALFWVRWNLCIDHRAEILYRIEDIKWEWKWLLQFMELPDVPFPEIEGKDNSKPHDELTWEYLARLNLNIHDEVRELAKIYGYSGGYIKADSKWTEIAVKSPSSYNPSGEGGLAQ